MKKLSFFFLAAVLFISGCSDTDFIRPSDDLTTVPVMDIFIMHESYEYLKKNRANDAKVSCRITYKDQTLDAEIRGAGAGSRYYPKWSYKVSLDEDLIEGYDEFNLSAQVSDPTLLATAITTDLYKRLGFPLFRTHFVFVRINGEDQGLYPLIERVEEEFFAERGLDLAVLFKAGFEARFSLNSGEYDPYFNYEKKYPDDENYNDLVEFMHAVDTSSSDKLQSSLGKFLDLDNYMKYHAMTILVNNIDAFSNNIFLHKETPTVPFKVIPWDFDKAFFNEAPIKSIYDYNDLIKKIQTSQETHKKYLEEFEYQINNVYTLDNIKAVGDSVGLIIKEAYNLDPYLGKGGRFNFDEEKERLYDFVAERKILLKKLLEEAKAKNNF